MQHSIRYALLSFRWQKLTRHAVALIACVYLFSTVAHHLVCMHGLAPAHVAAVSGTADDQGRGNAEVLPCEHCASCAHVLPFDQPAVAERLPVIQRLLPRVAMPPIHQAGPDTPPPKAVA